MEKRFKIIQFDWNEFVRGHVFEQVLISAAGVPITYLLVSGKGEHPAWLALDPLLSVLCFMFAFIRVWKSLMEEVEISDVQESLEFHLGKRSRRIDLIILPLYVFSLFLMPFFSVAFQFFIAILFLYYSISIGYNWMYLRALPEYYKSYSYTSEEEKRCPARRYLRTRQLLDIICLVFILAFGVIAWWSAFIGKTSAALNYGFFCIILLIIIEAIFEPMVNVDFHYFEEDTPEDGDGI